MTKWSIAWGEATPTRGPGGIAAVTPPPTPTLTVQTTYRAGVLRSDASAYGRGTTPEDVAGGAIDPRSTQLGFHEGNHALDFIAYVTANAPPAHGGTAGTVRRYNSDTRAWHKARADYETALQKDSETRTECVGTTIDAHYAAHPPRGRRHETVCGR